MKQIFLSFFPFAYGSFSWFSVTALKMKIKEQEPKAWDFSRRMGKHGQVILCNTNMQPLFPCKAGSSFGHRLSSFPVRVGGAGLKALLWEKLGLKLIGLK